MLGRACRADLLALVDAYCRKTGVTEEQAGFSLYGHRNFFSQFRAWERSITIDKYDELLVKLASLWPKGLRVPKMQLLTFPPGEKQIKKRPNLS